MFKKFTTAVVLGAIVGAVAYKIKKEMDDRKKLEEALEMLSSDEECTCDCDSECACDCECDCNCECENEEETIVEEILDEKEDIQEIIYVVEEETSNINEEKEVVEEKTPTDDSKTFQEHFNEEKHLDESAQKKTEFLEKSFQENPLTDNLSEQIKKELDENSDMIIEQLNDESDESKIERPIIHAIDFKSIDDLEKYKALVIEKGYVVTKGENQYQLNVLHIAPIKRSELLVNVYYLANLAVKHNATYLGWQSRKVL